jgi:hypothetical protein
MNARVGRTLSMSDIVQAANITKLDLRFAVVNTLDHSDDSWPERERLWINGLIYNAFGEVSRGKLNAQWLQLQPRRINVQPTETVFSLQPYEQLAGILKTSGYEAEATEVLIAKQDDLRHFGELNWWAKRWNWFLGVTLKHGYKPHRALWGMLFFIVLGTVFFQAGYWSHLITPANELKNEPTARQNYPRFQAFVYSFETFVPLVDLKQKAYWLPNPNLGSNVIPGVRLRWGGLLRIYYWIHIMLGWVLRTLWVAGFSGLVRKLR